MSAHRSFRPAGVTHKQKNISNGKKAKLGQQAYQAELARAAAARAAAIAARGDSSSRRF